MKKVTTLVLFTIISLHLHAQSSPNVEMADLMRRSGKIYVVIATISIVFKGLAIYLFSIDKKLKKLEKKTS